jgi:hypothetical protein
VTGVTPAYRCESHGGGWAGAARARGVSGVVSTQTVVYGFRMALLSGEHCERRLFCVCAIIMNEAMLQQIADVCCHPKLKDVSAAAARLSLALSRADIGASAGAEAEVSPPPTKSKPPPPPPLSAAPSVTAASDAPP